MHSFTPFFITKLLSEDDILGLRGSIDLCQGEYIDHEVPSLSLIPQRFHPFCTHFLPNVKNTTSESILLFIKKMG